MISHLPLPSRCDARWALRVLWDKPLTTGGFIAGTGEVKVEENSHCPQQGVQCGRSVETGQGRRGSVPELQGAQVLPSATFCYPCVLLPEQILGVPRVSSRVRFWEQFCTSGKGCGQPQPQLSCCGFR